MRPNIFVLLFIMLSISGIASAYVTQIQAPAVILNQSRGTLTQISLNLTNGTGRVFVTGASEVGSDTVASAATAAQYAAAYVGVNEDRYNFTYNISAVGDNVSGPSAGLAFTLLAVSALEHRQLPTDFSVTGEIFSSGEVGAVGGLYDKTGAVAAAGLKYFIVPSVQNGSFTFNNYYIAQQRFGIPLVQVANVTQALAYLYGNATPTPVKYDLLVDYHAGTLPAANSTCNDCNLSAFAQVTNFTFNLVASQAASLPGNYTNVTAQENAQLSQYKAIASKGYLYTPADLAFLDYINLFVFANAEHLSAANVSRTIENVSDYCSSVTPPPMTSTNYEYVIGGELRQSWANVTIVNTEQTFNSTGDSDQLIESLYSVAPAYAWCKASQEMYTLAGQMNGTYVSADPLAQQRVGALVSNLSDYPNNIYTQSAKELYKQGDYAAAMYDAAYAKVFSGSIPTLTYNSSTTLMLNQMAANATGGMGVWPHEFANEGRFYIYEAEQANNSTTANAYINDAYSSLLLSEGLNSSNSYLTSTFLLSSTSPVALQQLQSQIDSLKSQVAWLDGIVIVLFVLFLVVLLILMAKSVHKEQPANTRRRRR